ncbi:MAG: TIGR02147 family protein [Chitinispirillaceae bacterium]|nr:TIGR02147 family protein [Chitinispirillaceae bacterium]
MAVDSDKPNIFNYFNYREYLSALFNYNKAINPIFSHRYIITKAGFKSPNSLKNVINGERNLSVEGAERFATAFKMETKERVYFILLVQFNTVKSPKEKERCLSELLKLRKSSLPAGLKDEQMDIMSAWWHVAIREITALPDFKNSSLWISRVLMPPIKKGDAASSLHFLKKTGFIRKTEIGWRPVEKIMQSDPEVTHIFASQFHREMIRLGMEAIARFSYERREISSTTLRLSGRDVPHAKSLLQHFRRQMLDFASNSQDADQVYQLNFQFFPLVNPDRSHRINKKKERQP